MVLLNCLYTTSKKSSKRLKLVQHHFESPGSIQSIQMHFFVLHLQNHADGYSGIGMMYLHGMGVEQVLKL